MIFTVPNLITLSRIGAIIVMWLLFPSYPFTTLSVFLWALLSDWLDGWLARKLNCTSVLGAIFDPIADKIFYIGTLWLFREYLTMLLIFLAALPEIMLVVIRLLALAGMVRATIPATRIGKYKMAFHYGTLILLFFANFVDLASLWGLGGILVGFGIVFSYGSAISHLRE